MHRSIIWSALAATALLAPQAAGAATTSFADPAGDSATAPDVTSVTLERDSKRNLIFHLSVANHADLATGEAFAIAFDADGDLSTGADGIDELLVLDGDERSWVLLERSGGEWEPATRTESIRVASPANEIVFGMNADELGLAPTF